MHSHRLTYAVITIFALTAVSSSQESSPGIASRTDAFQKLRQARVAALSGEVDKAHQLVADIRTWAYARKDQLVIAWAEQLRGEFAFTARKYDDAKEAFTAALQTFTALSDRAGMANCRLNIGRVAQSTGQHGDAVKHQQAALELYEALNRPAETATTLSDLAATYQAQARWSDAKASLEKALTLYRGPAKQPASEARTLSELAACCDAAGETSQALQHLNAAAALASELSDPAERARLNNALGLLKHKTGALDEAGKHYRAALELYATVRESDSATAAVRNNLGALLQEQGKPQEALTELTAALEALTRTGDVPGQARAYYNLALVHEGQGQEAKAVQAYEKALTLRRQSQDAAGSARVLDNLALLYAAQGKTDQAKTARNEAEQLRKR
jgi:tetratricopeptide (TPR) repeat protein